MRPNWTGDKQVCSDWVSHHDYNKMINRHRQIQDRAYFLWNEEGRPDGRAVEFWLLAEKEWEEDDEFTRRRMLRWGS